MIKREKAIDDMLAHIKDCIRPAISHLCIEVIVRDDTRDMEVIFPSYYRGHNRKFFYDERVIPKGTACRVWNESDNPEGLENGEFYVRVADGEGRFYCAGSSCGDIEKDTWDRVEPMDVIEDYEGEDDED